MKQSIQIVKEVKRIIRNITLNTFPIHIAFQCKWCICPYLRSQMDLFNTAIGGLNNAGKSREKIRRAIWMIIFIGGLVGTLHSTVVVVQDMLAFPVDTTVTISRQDNVISVIWGICNNSDINLLILQINFPSVTVCNQNRIDCSKLSSIIQACVNLTSTSCSVDSETERNTLTSLMDYCPPPPNSKRKKRQSGPPSIDDLGAVPAMIDEENTFLNMYMGVST